MAAKTPTQPDGQLDRLAIALWKQADMMRSFSCLLLSGSAQHRSAEDMELSPHFLNSLEHPTEFYGSTGAGADFKRNEPLVLGYASTTTPFSVLY
jgi:hypothetical protein